MTRRALDLVTAGLLAAGVVLVAVAVWLVIGWPGPLLVLGLVALVAGWLCSTVEPRQPRHVTEVPTSMAALGQLPRNPTPDQVRRVLNADA